MMSPDSSSNQRLASEPLQFGRAEFAEPPADVVCTGCGQPIRFEYFEVNTSVVCRNCRNAVSHLGTEGSSISRFMRALMAGGATAAIGCLVYFAIAKLTGYEFALIAVAIGFGVGSAVKWGCYGRGGWRYQMLAMTLTYFAIVFTYIPYIIEGLQDADEAEVEVTSETDASAVATPVVQQTTIADSSATSVDEPVSLSGVVVAVGVVVVLAAIAPFLVGIQNIVGLIIIAIGLWEAWKINKRPVFAISGPHMLNARPRTAPATTA